MNNHKEVCSSINGAQSLKLQKGTIEFKPFTIEFKATWIQTTEFKQLNSNNWIVWIEFKQLNLRQPFTPYQNKTLETLQRVL